MLTSWELCANRSGPTLEAIGITLATSDTIMRIIGIIEDALVTINKNWFFVFDQVNRIFARPECAAASVFSHEALE